MSEKHRVQFDFTPEAYKELETLQARIGVPTKAETVRYGMRALQWIIKEIDADNRILVERAGVPEAVIFPFLGQKKLPKVATRR